MCQVEITEDYQKHLVFIGGTSLDHFIHSRVTTMSWMRMTKIQARDIETGKKKDFFMDQQNVRANFLI